jgi:hypothetical protein
MSDHVVQYVLRQLTFYQNAVQKTMLLAMGFGLRAKAKDVIWLHFHARGGGFIKDRETSDGKFVQPNWSMNFARNAAWHDHMLTMIRQKVLTVYPSFARDLLATKSDGDIIDCMEAVFKNLRTTYLKKGQEGDLDSDADDKEDDEVLHKQRNHCWQRKTRVSDPALA